jgi:hypothetical protein
MKMMCLFLGCLTPLAAFGGELPPPFVPAGVGVNIHFVTGHEQDLDLIAEAGFRVIRMDFGWLATERQRGVYDWSEYDQLLAQLDKRGVRALFILDYSNPLYEETVTSEDPISHRSQKSTASPQHPESVAAFARWAAAAAKHYQGRRVLWEIWNEPNIQFWSPKPDAQQYTTLALATGKAVREADPEATIIGPASSGFPWDFLETFFKSGVLEYLDGVSVHPYRDGRRGPETAAADYAKLRELISRHTPAARNGAIPILSGEWGYSSNTRGVSLETQAAYAARQQLANLLEGVPLSIWYDWKNDGSDPAENEHNFGTVFPDLKPKPAYEAIRTLTRELTGYHLEKRVPVGNDKDYVLVFLNAMGARKLAAWTTGEPHTTNMVFAKGTLTATPADNPAAENLALQLTAAPQYLALTEPGTK